MYKISKKGYFYKNNIRISKNKLKEEIMKGGGLENLCPVFNLDLIIEVIKSSNKLIDNTNESDILIFIGQSPDYLSYIVKEYRKVISVPISGRPYGDEYSIPKDININNYCNLLNNLGVTNDLFEKNNVILIDHSHSGQSPSLFAKVLLRCLGYIDKYSKNLSYSNKQFKFVNIVGNNQYPYHIVDPPLNYVRTIGYLLMPNLVAFANEGKPIGSEFIIPRTIPHYPHWKWDKSPDYIALKEGNQCVLKLKLFYNFFKRFIVECNNLSNESRSTLLYFVNILKKVVNKEGHINLLNEINDKSLKRDICQKINIILGDININISFIKK